MEASQVSALLLEHVRSPVAAAWLLGTTGPKDPVSLAAELPRDMQLSFRGKPWAQTASIAKSSADGEVLAALASDGRAGVRRAVASNVATSPETLRQLFGVALADGDYDLVKLTSAKLPAEELVDAFMESPECARSHDAIVNVRSKIRASSNPAVHDAVLTLGSGPLLTETATALRDGLIDHIPIDEIVAAAPEDQRHSILAAYVTDGVLDEDRAEAVVRIEPQLTKLYVDRQRSMTEAAQRVLIGSGSDRLRAWALRSLDVPRHLVVAALDAFEAEGLPAVIASSENVDLDEVAPSLLAILALQLGRMGDEPALVERVAGLVSAAGFPDPLPQRVLEQAPCQLPTSVRLDLLRRGDLPTTTSLLTATSGCRIEPGDLPALLAEPGSALKARHKYCIWDRSGGAAQPEVLAEHWKGVLTDVSPEVLDDIAAVLGPVYVRLLRDGSSQVVSAVAAHVARQLDVAFGDDVAQWEVAIGFLASWEDDIASLVEFTSDCYARP